MPRLIAFLRAINVGGHTVTMEKLRREFEGMGLKDVETFIASGNVIFTARQADTVALEKKIEARLHKALGYEVATFVRSCEEVAAVAGYRPFPGTRIDGDATVYVGFVGRITVQVRQSGKETEDPRDLPRHQHRDAAGGQTRSVMIPL